MTQESTNKLLHSSVAGAIAGLGLFPGAAAAETVLEVALALDTPIEPPTDVSQLDVKAIAPNVEVKTRNVEWDVPWIEQTETLPETASSLALPTVVTTQLAMGFAEESAAVEFSQTDFPLIAVAEAPLSDVDVTAFDGTSTTVPEPTDSVQPSLVAQPATSDSLPSQSVTASETVLAESDAVDIGSQPTSLSELLEKSVAVEPLTVQEGEDSYETIAPSLEITADVSLAAEAPRLALLDKQDAFDVVNSALPTVSFEDEESSQIQPVQVKAPWLARSLSANELDERETIPQTIVSLIALRSADDDEENEESEEPWLAYAVIADEAAEAGKAPWLARSSNSDSSAEEADARLAITLPQAEAKRPAPWISLTPVELLGEEATDDIALRDLTSGRAGAQSYDVTGLQQIAITPEDLANPDEIAVTVDASEVEFLSPEAGAFLDIPATSVVLRFPIGANIALLANGQLVDSTLVGRTESDPETQLRTQTWYGVPLLSGENILEVISTEDGVVLQSLPLSVRGQPDKLVLLSPRTIPSDGRSTAAIRGQLVDESGNISRWDSTATLRASDGRFVGADQDPDVPGFQVEVQRGEFVAELQSSLESHLVQIQANASGFEAFGQIQFDTPQRPSLVSGVIDLRVGAEGTDFYDSYREFLPVNGDNDYAFDVDAAVFATGNLGEWLYTGAYNSDRTLNEDCNGDSALFRTTSGNCSNLYPTYGDDSYSDVVSPSIDSVYLRLERNSPTNNTGIDYAMWGDFNTQEFSSAAQLFTATNRQLHGFKANYNFGNLSATGLYANNVEGFQRDTIAPDGTSGLYFTSERELIPGSEDIFIELEELERPGTVLERVALTRGADYEIDYDRGTILFNDPVTRTSVDDFGQVLVRRIVTTYQHEDGQETDILAGRLRYDLNTDHGRESWVGASILAEDQGTRDFTLYGADAQISLSDNAQLTAEFAESSSDFETSGNVSGSAYRVELNGDIGRRLNGQAYFRSTDTGFTNSATTSFVPGQTRYGAQVTGRLTETTALRARYDHEDNNGIAPQVITDVSDLLSGINRPGAELDNALTTYSLGLTQKIGAANAEVDWIHRDRTDRLNEDTNLSSDQIRSRLSVPLSRKLTLVAQNELDLSSRIDPIYPSRTLLGINWEAMQGVNVGLNQVFYGGGENNRGSYTSLDVTGEHTFASDTTVRGRFSTIDGRQLGGSIGLEQGITLSPGLNLDLGYEKVFTTFGNETAASTQFSQPFATGTSASALGLSGGESYSVGLSYTDNPDFQASTRFEHRNSSQSSNTVFDISALGRLSPAFTVLGDYRLSNAANQNITDLGSTSLLKLGLAYRDPANDRFNALLRYEHRMNPNSIPTIASVGTTTETQEHLMSAEAIYAPNWRWELYGKYALRNSQTDISGIDNTFSNNNTVQLAQARATYRVGYRWDVVGEARWLASGDFSETGYALEAGYYPLPDLRLSAGYSGGAADRDFGENRNSGGFYFGATAKLSGLLNGFSTRPRNGLGTQPNDPSQQEESVVNISQESVVPAQPTAATDEDEANASTDAQALTEESSTFVNQNYPSGIGL